MGIYFCITGQVVRVLKVSFYSLFASATSFVILADLDNLEATEIHTKKPFKECLLH